MRHLLVAAVLVGALSLVCASSATAGNPPSCSSGAASGSRITCAMRATDPTQAEYNALKTRLGGDIANGLAAEQRLSATLDQYAGIEVSLTAEISQEEEAISAIESDIARLDGEIADTQQRIDVEKAQLATLSRDIYRQPDSIWMLVARSGNLHEALVATADAVVAGERAHALQDRLQGDLTKLQADRVTRQSDLDREQNTIDLLTANLSSLQDVMTQEGIVSGELAGLVSQLQGAESHMQDVPPDVTANLTLLLESQEQDLILRSYQTAWTEAEVGTGLAMVNHALPAGKTIAGLTLSWPMSHFTITQGFGPTTFALEPPLGPYKHFHTGIDMAAPLGMPVMAAGDGVVVAVAHGSLGYGNYIVIAHGGGIATLYGHLLRTNVTVGQKVARGQVIGLEGSSGYSTGPHLHFELRVSDQVTDPMPYLPIPGTTVNG